MHPRWLPAVLLAAATATPVAGATIYINSTLIPAPVNGTAVMNGKYRLSNNNFDQTIDTGTSANQVTANLGNNNYLSGRTWDFRLEHHTGEGFIFSMTSGAVTSVVSWGTFATPPGGTNAPTLGGQAPGAAFNAILLTARATRNNSSFSFSNLAFSSPTLTASGAFEAGTVTPATSGPGDPLGLWVQHMLAPGVNLALHDWILTGLLTGVRDSGTGDETVRFLITPTQFDGLQPFEDDVPEPPTMALILGGLLVFAGAVRRHGGPTS